MHRGKEVLGSHGLHFGGMTTSLSVLRASLNYEERGKTVERDVKTLATEKMLQETECLENMLLVNRVGKTSREGAGALFIVNSMPAVTREETLLDILPPFAQKNLWLTKGIKISCENKRRLYKAIRSSSKPDTMNHYRKFRKILSKRPSHCQKCSKRYQWNALQVQLNKHRPDTLDHLHNQWTIAKCPAKKRGGKLKTPEKTRRPAASSGTRPTCEILGAIPPVFEPGSPGWEESMALKKSSFILRKSAVDQPESLHTDANAGHGIDARRPGSLTHPARTTIQDYNATAYIHDRDNLIQKVLRTTSRIIRGDDNQKVRAMDSKSFILQKDERGETYPVALSRTRKQVIHTFHTAEPSNSGHDEALQHLTSKYSVSSLLAFGLSECIDSWEKEQTTKLTERLCEFTESPFLKINVSVILRRVHGHLRVTFYRHFSVKHRARWRSGECWDGSMRKAMTDSFHNPSSLCNTCTVSNDLALDETNSVLREKLPSNSLPAVPNNCEVVAGTPTNSSAQVRISFKKNIKKIDQGISSCEMKENLTMSNRGEGGGEVVGPCDAKKIIFDIRRVGGLKAVCQGLMGGERANRSATAAPLGVGCARTSALQLSHRSSSGQLCRDRALDSQSTLFKKFPSFYGKVLVKIYPEVPWQINLRVESALFVLVTLSQTEYGDFPYFVFTDLTPFFVTTDRLSADSQSYTKDEVARYRWLRTTNLPLPAFNCFSANMSCESGMVWMLVQPLPFYDWSRKDLGRGRVYCVQREVPRRQAAAGYQAALTRDTIVAKAETFHRARSPPTRIRSGAPPARTPGTRLALHGCRPRLPPSTYVRPRLHSAVPVDVELSETRRQVTAMTSDGHVHQSAHPCPKTGWDSPNVDTRQAHMLTHNSPCNPSVRRSRDLQPTGGQLFFLSVHPLNVYQTLTFDGRTDETPPSDDAPYTGLGILKYLKTKSRIREYKQTRLHGIGVGCEDPTSAAPRETFPCQSESRRDQRTAFRLPVFGTLLRHSERQFDPRKSMIVPGTQDPPSLSELHSGSYAGRERERGLADDSRTKLTYTRDFNPERLLAFQNVTPRLKREVDSQNNILEQSLAVKVETKKKERRRNTTDHMTDDRKCKLIHTRIKQNTMPTLLVKVHCNVEHSTAMKTKYSYNVDYTQPETGDSTLRQPPLQCNTVYNTRLTAMYYVDTNPRENYPRHFLARTGKVRRLHWLRRESRSLGMADSCLDREGVRPFLPRGKVRRLHWLRRESRSLGMAEPGLKQWKRTTAQGGLNNGAVAVILCHDLDKPGTDRRPQCEIARPDGPTHGLSASRLLRCAPGDAALYVRASVALSVHSLLCHFASVQRHGGNTARLARRSDEALVVRVIVARIAPSLLDLVAWRRVIAGKTARQFSALRVEAMRELTGISRSPLALPRFQASDVLRNVYVHASERKDKKPTRRHFKSTLSCSRFRDHVLMTSQRMLSGVCGRLNPSEKAQKRESKEKERARNCTLATQHILATAVIVIPHLLARAACDGCACQFHRAKERQDVLSPDRAKECSLGTNRIRFPAGTPPDFRMWESRMPLVGGFFSGIPVSPALAYSPQSPSSALKTSLLIAAEISSLAHENTAAIATGAYRGCATPRNVTGLGRFTIIAIPVDISSVQVKLRNHQPWAGLAAFRACGYHVWSTYARLHHRGSKLDPRSDLRSTRKTVAPLEFSAEVHSEPPKLAVRNLDPRSAAIIDESEIQHHAFSLVQHFYIGTKIKLDPGSELSSFDRESGKMLVQPGIRLFTVKWAILRPWWPIVILKGG
ncbi:hypothetical protein PR048_020552 [Dryococelus australis]|uniref:Uncharacterized protein n=1 Tax=Dryococelus australis TaxID=614101 RepID=A0ABQ9H6K3_9NEOP|nr:hypothetical protein PR048_020552 [Dryococelus australis]